MVSLSIAFFRQWLCVSFDFVPVRTVQKTEGKYPDIWERLLSSWNDSNIHPQILNLFGRNGLETRLASRRNRDAAVKMLQHQILIEIQYQDPVIGRTCMNFLYQHSMCDTDNHRRHRDMTLRNSMNCCSRCLFAIQIMTVTIYILYYTFENIFNYFKILYFNCTIARLCYN
jgi:hypothetical protein